MDVNSLVQQLTLVVTGPVTKEKLLHIALQVIDLVETMKNTTLEDKIKLITATVVALINKDTTLSDEQKAELVDISQIFLPPFATIIYDLTLKSCDGCNKCF